MLQKASIDNNFTPSPTPESRTVDFCEGPEFIRNLLESGFTVTKMVEDDFSVYVEWTT
jgi:hypothetical protein